VVLSGYSGSNKGGFTIIRSNTKGDIRLDGLFNIVSYDAVPKLQGVLVNSDFKVVIADESHFLKNAQAKRTTATLPILQVSLSLHLTSFAATHVHLGGMNKFWTRILSKKSIQTLS
ncbi:SWI/SNF-related matrix-associated actin-dependent regulator of chromatin subfamily A-like protein 1 isoform X2, partial [Tanacetum coccineum]